MSSMQAAGSSRRREHAHKVVVVFALVVRSRDRCASVRNVRAVRATLALSLRDAPERPSGFVAGTLRRRMSHC